MHLLLTEIDAFLFKCNGNSLIVQMQQLPVQEQVRLSLVWRHQARGFPRGCSACCFWIFFCKNWNYLYLNWQKN